MQKKSKDEEELEEIEEAEIEEIIEEIEKEAVEEKEKKKEEKEPVKERRREKKKKREKREPIVRDDLSEIENLVVNLIGYEPRRPRAITRLLKGKLNQNEVVSLLKQLEEKKIVKREGTKSWIMA